jgi:chromosome segregation ATPase
LVQFRLKHVLEGERRLRRATLALEEAEDAAAAKRDIEHRTKALTGAALKRGREQQLRRQLDATASRLAQLEAELAEKKRAFDDLAARLAAAKAELSRLDRVVLSAQQQKTLKSSDVRATAAFQQQFAELDALRMQLDAELRQEAHSAVAARTEMAATREARRGLLGKLERVASSKAVQAPPQPAASSKNQRSSAVTSANTNR